MNRIQLPLMLVFFLFSSLGYADVYKWTDDKGEVHYTQHKPTKYESVLVDEALFSPSNIDDIGAGGTDTKNEDRSSLEPDHNPNINKEQCKIAKQNIKSLESGVQLRYVGSDGKTVDMTKEDKASQLILMKKSIKFYCE